MASTAQIVGRTQTPRTGRGEEPPTAWGLLQGQQWSRSLMTSFNIYWVTAQTQKWLFVSVNMSISFGYKIKLCAGHIADWLKLVLKIYHFIIMLVRKKRKNSFLAGATVWNLYILLLSVWVFCGDSGFFPHPKDVHVWWTGVSTLSHSEWVCVQVWVCPVTEGCLAQGPTHDPELE